MIYSSGGGVLSIYAGHGLKLLFCFLNFHFKIQLNQFKIRKIQLNLRFPYDFLHTFSVLISPPKPPVVSNLSGPNIEYMFHENNVFFIDKIVMLNLKRVNVLNIFVCPSDLCVLLPLSSHIIIL